MVLASLFAFLANDSIHGNDVLIVAADEGQAADDLALTKKLIHASPYLLSRVRILEKEITRRDGKGTLKILPGKDTAGAHGKTARLVGIDEVHVQRDWSLLEALQLDPTWPDSQMWITSYSSIHHRPGVPLYDLLKQGQRGDDPRMLLSWFAADWCSDPAMMDLDPERRANPSIASFAPDYLDMQRRRLPSHVYDACI